MNIQQFKYILAVAKTQHFETAAELCYISQSTLSTMVSRFENEIGIKIFDRKKKPVKTTHEGDLIIEQLKSITKEIEQLNELTQEIKGEVKGNLSMAVIPTIAPFLLPLFLQNFAQKFPDLNIEVKEQTTAEIIRNIKLRELDIGIISIPVLDPDIKEVKLYDEPFRFFNATHDDGQKIKSQHLDVNSLCLLEEGHCMRTQVIKLCDLHKKNLKSKLNFEYKAGSIDSLLRFVKANKATTLLPLLSTIDMSTQDQKHLSAFSNPVPFRSVGLVVHRHYVKNQVLKILKSEILEKVGQVMDLDDLEGEMLLPV
ncbi:MAG: LysR substrate-binding domain-containing protein [Bacteroidia bacterium]